MRKEGRHKESRRKEGRHNERLFNDRLDHSQVMRIAAWMWVIYLVILAAVDFMIHSRGRLFPFFWYHTINAIPALLFLVFALTPWVRSKTATLLMILLISGAPILVNNLLILRLPPGPLSNVEGMALRQLPVLFIALVLVAWHYRLIPTLIFSLGTNLIDLGLVTLLNRFTGEQLNVFIVVVIIRTASFILVGLFINRLITRLRSQQKALASANARLAHYASTLENLTISRERNRMSRELHDTVIHTLSGLAVQLETAKAYRDVDPAAAADLLDQSLAATRNGLQETRRALKDLRATPLEDLGLLLALSQLAEDAAERGRLVLDLQLAQELPVLSPDVEQSLYRVAQEAIENVVQHASAKTLTVSLALEGSLIKLSVQDDGIGYRMNNGPLPGHFGLTGMRERAQVAGGELKVSSRPAQGTLIELTIEVDAP